MKDALLVLGFTLTAFSFLPLIKSPLWWIRVLDFPRLHVAVLLTATLIAFVARYGLQDPTEIVILVVWALAILNEVRFIVPFTPLAKVVALRSEQKNPKNAFTMLIANVRMVNKKYDAFVELALQQDADIVIMNEPGEEWYQNVEPALQKRYPYAIKKPLNNTYGMLLWSKLKLEETEIRFLVEDEIPSFYAQVVLPSGAKFGLYTVHPQPPRFMKNTETRGAELLLVAKQVKENPLPCVIAGDLNDVAWSKTTELFKEISTTLDPRVGRGFYNTYNAFIPLFRYPLDHVFYNPAFRLISLKRLQKFGSDHFPITITLNYEPQVKEKQEHPVADQEDKQQAHEMIAEGLEKGQELNAEKK